MTIIAISTNVLSTVVKNEYKPEKGFCRDAVVVNDAALTFKVGQVLGATLTGGAGVATATAGNTGNATSSAVTANGNAAVGSYNVVFTAATAFEIYAPNGNMRGVGATGTAVAVDGVGFTITAGATPMIVGDSFVIAVTGTVKYKVCVATATDGSQNAKAIYIADIIGNSGDLAIAATTDTTIVAITRGPVQVAKGALVVDASITGAFLTKMYADLAAVNGSILSETTI
jgi:hypothetical protein